MLECRVLGNKKSKKTMLQNLQSNTSTIIKKKCIYCGKLAHTKSETNDLKKKKILLECGHTLIEYLEEIKAWETESLTGKKPFPHQYKTLDFMIGSNFRTGIFHAMGVGKTACPLMAIKRFPEKLLPALFICKSSLKAQMAQEIFDWTGLISQTIDGPNDKAFPELFKVFIVSFDILRNKKVAEAISKMTFNSAIIDECQQIKNSQSKRTQALRTILSGHTVRPRKFDPNLPKRERIKTIAIDLMTYHGLKDRFTLSFEALEENTLGLCESNAKKENEGIIKGRITIDRTHAENDSEDNVIETILHEIAHAITPGAGHSKIWSDTSIAIGGDGRAKAGCDGTIEIKETISQRSIPYVFGLSGTPIKNHSGEYFTILNMIRPDIFPSQAQYERDFCDVYSSGWSQKIGGFSRWGAQRFKELTDSWIIRFEREDVLPDLPKIFRKNLFVDFPDGELEKAYKRAYQDFRADYLSSGNSFSEQGNLLAKLNKLRHIAGLMKVDSTIEYVEEFLEETERKLCLFVHHKDVGMALFNHLDRVCRERSIKGPLQLTSEISNSPQGFEIDNLWKTDPSRRLMVASTLSAGEGKNWQMCQDAVIVERQWNPANEEQAEARFPRPGSIAESISITYMVALGTPDEYLSELVSRKREICRKTYGNEAIAWNQDSLIKEMSELLIQKGGKKWGL